MRPISAGAPTRLENILWRLENGELDGVNPKIIVLLAGTNNVGNTVPPEGDDAKVADITKGLKAVLDMLRAKAPDATIIATAIFPRNDNMAVMPDHRQDQSQSSETGRRQEDPVSRYQREARRSGRQAVRRHDERRQAASRDPRLPGLGGCLEADLYGIARSPWKAGPRPAAHRRSERETLGG